MIKKHNIMVIGQSWHGSDCTGLARGFRELGHAVELIGTDQFFPKTNRSFTARLIRKTLTPFYCQQFNKHIIKQTEISKPDLVIIFKGNQVQQKTLQHFKSKGIWLCNFYPDVSFMCHKDLDSGGFKFYNHIFTTKSFGIDDFKQQLGLTNVSFLPHGFDPLVHRPINQINTGKQSIDVSFIGTWSPHKQNILQYLAKMNNTGILRIYGSQWNKTMHDPLHQCVTEHEVFGDFYASTISQTKINLGLLSEKREGASMGDQITSRTFHIPASGGFLLHERTEEVLEYFEEGKEIACFDTPEELCNKVQYYLENDKERKQIAKAGYLRCISENSLKDRAGAIIKKFEEKAN